MKRSQLRCFDISANSWFKYKTKAALRWIDLRAVFYSMGKSLKLKLLCKDICSKALICAVKKQNQTQKHKVIKVEEKISNQAANVLAIILCRQAECLSVRLSDPVFSFFFSLSLCVLLCLSVLLYLSSLSQFSRYISVYLSILLATSLFLSILFYSFIYYFSHTLNYSCFSHPLPSPLRMIQSHLVYPCHSNQPLPSMQSYLLPTLFSVI